jgi:hypothetical protein
MSREAGSALGSGREFVRGAAISVFPEMELFKASDRPRTHTLFKVLFLITQNKTLACTSRPSKWAWRGPREVRCPRSGSSPGRRTRAPALGLLLGGDQARAGAFAVRPSGWPSPDLSVEDALECGARSIAVRDEVTCDGPPRARRKGATRVRRNCCSIPNRSARSRATRGPEP